MSKENLLSAIKELPIPLISPPRPGKKLLVLDLDYTLWDGNAQVEQLSQKLRPGLHDFLVKVGEYYDIIIWSNNPIKFLTMKLQAIGLLNTQYKIIAVLDKSFIFKIKANDGRKVSVKALEIIWNQFKNFNAHNTIHVDDNQGNFSLNPDQGLKISPFKVYQQDHELEYLEKYLVRIASEKDFINLNHKNWRHL